MGSEPPKIGIVMFDDPAEPSSLIYSVNGSPAEKASSIQYLDSSVNWITNLSFKQFGKKFFKLSKYKGFSAESAIKPGLISLLKQYQQNSPEKTIQIVSSFVQRLAALSVQYHQTPIENHLFLENLKGHVKHINQYGNFGSYATEIQNATQTLQKNSAEYFSAPYQIETFYFPHAAYCKWLLTKPVPSCKSWKKIVTQDKVLGKADSLDLLQNLENIHKSNALFFKIKLRVKDKSQLEFSEFGIGADHKRTWATYPEVLKLQEYYYVTLKEGFSCPFNHLLLPDYFAQDNHFSISMSCLMLNFAQAILLPNNGKYNTASTYLKAYDRCELLHPIAKCFNEKGYSIASYGAGKISLCLKQFQVEDATRLAYKLGLNTRKHLFKIGLFAKEPSSILPDKMAQCLENDWIGQLNLFQAMTGQNMIDDLLALDAYSMKSIDEQWENASNYLATNVLPKLDLLDLNSIDNDNEDGDAIIL